jgi:amino acid adenylation domain-containing protein
MMNTLHALFEEQVKIKPNRIAAVYGVRSISYQEINVKANQLAHYLLKAGIKPETPVALCLERSFDFLISIIAILKAGCAYLPLDGSQPQDRLLFLLNDSKAPFLITQSTLKGTFSQYPGTTVALDALKDQLNQQAKENPAIEVTKNQLAYIIYTSGSTGTPKGVLIEHHSVVNYCHWFAHYNRKKPHQNIDFSSNPIFDMSVSISIVPLMLGLTVVICSDEVKKEARRYLHYLVTSKVNCIKLTPSFFKMLLHELKNNFVALPHLQSIILGGEYLTSLECKSWLSLFPNHVLFNEYGPTEATVAVSVYKVTKANLADLEANVPIGTAGAHISCSVFDTNNMPVPAGEMGELVISGACLARGYLNQPELTAQQFITTKENIRFYKTGDLCTMRTDGVIEYHGRMDHQVKIRGFRIEPGEIEKHLSKHAEINDVVVLAKKDTCNEPRLIAYCTVKDADNAPNSRQMRHYLQQHVPDYMIPTFFIILSSFPLAASGKLDRKALPDAPLTLSEEYIKPSNALEKKLAKIWAEELGVALIGINDNFFELGGHSLSAARIVSKINNRARKNISLHDFYEASTIAKLIPVIKKTKKLRHPNKEKHSSIRDIPLNDFQFTLWIANTFDPKVKKLNIVGKKRIHGQLDKDALEFAFNAVLKKQEVLNYRVEKFCPWQQVQKNPHFKMTEHHITSLSRKQQNMELEESMNQLANVYPWPKNTALLSAKLYHLQENISELQICMPHLISDYDSLDILFADLSKFYLLYKEHSVDDELKIDTGYKEYTFNMQDNLQKHLDTDVVFWKDYLRDTSLFAFPKEQVINNMQSTGLPYSTYVEIPEQKLNILKHFCEKNQISINNGLCAALALALRNCCPDYKTEAPCFFMNRVKSTRDDPVYDDTLGCFLRIEPIKITMDSESTLSTLSQQIHHAVIDTSSYQQCSNLIKITSISTFYQKKFKNFFMNLITPLYTKLLRFPPLYCKIFKLCGERLAPLAKNNNFLININIRSDFISETHTQKSNLFGLITTDSTNYKEDLLAIDNVFEVCFIRDDEGAYYLVLSANLNPDFREIIAKEVTQAMGMAV